MNFIKHPKTYLIVVLFMVLNCNVIRPKLDLDSLSDTYLSMDSLKTLSLKEDGTYTYTLPDVRFIDSKSGGVWQIIDGSSLLLIDSLRLYPLEVFLIKISENPKDSIIFNLDTLSYTRHDWPTMIYFKNGESKRLELSINNARFTKVDSFKIQYSSGSAMYRAVESKIVSTINLSGEYTVLVKKDYLYKRSFLHDTLIIKNEIFGSTYLIHYRDKLKKIED